MSLRTEDGSEPAATSASVTRSSTERRAARIATHTSRRRDRGAVVRRLLRAHAPHVGERPVHGADDVGHGDAVGGSSEAVAAVGTALAGDEPGPAQVDEDVLQELERELLCVGERLALDRAAFGRQFSMARTA